MIYIYTAGVASAIMYSTKNPGNVKITGVFLYIINKLYVVRRYSNFLDYLLKVLPFLV